MKAGPGPGEIWDEDNMKNGLVQNTQGPRHTPPKNSWAHHLKMAGHIAKEQQGTHPRNRENYSQDRAGHTTMSDPGSQIRVVQNQTYKRAGHIAQEYAGG